MHQRLATTVPAAILEQVRALGGIGQVTKPVLDELGIVRLVNPIHRTQHLVMAQAYGRLVGRTLAILNRYRGYIHAPSLNRMLSFISCRDVLTHAALDQIERDARRFVQNGIPPIFDPEHLSPSRFVYFSTQLGTGLTSEYNYPTLFPMVDFVIQYGAGTYETNCAHMGVKLDSIREQRTKLELKPIGPREVFLFRSRAFMPDGRIDPMLIDELLEYVETHFRISANERRQEILERYTRLFPFLETTLRVLPHEPHRYLNWDGDPSVVVERRWYLDYAPELRPRMAQAYLEYLCSCPLPLRESERQAFKRLFRHFPEVCSEVAEQLGCRNLVPKTRWYERQIAEALRNGTAHTLPRRVLREEPWRPLVQASMERTYRNACQALADPSLLLNGTVEIDIALGFSAGTSLIDYLKPILDEERLRVARLLPDERFLATVRNSSHCAALGHTKMRRPHASGVALQSYLQDRLAQLGA